jgi:ferredoxin-NADP reductase
MALRELPPLPPRPAAARPLPPRASTPAAARRLAAEPNATLLGRIDITEAVVALRFRPDEPIPFAAGQYISLGLRVDGRLVQRPYSPASAPGAPEIELLIRRVASGELTPHLWGLMPGARVHLGRAKGLFRLDPDDTRDHLFVATGTGIAPMVAMIGELLARPRTPTVALFHGVAHRRELAFADRLGDWAAENGRFRYLPAVSRPDHVENRAWSGYAGRLTQLLPDLLGEISCVPGRTVAYLCGNPAVVNGVRDGLCSRGVPEEAIRHEEYWAIT